MIGAYPNEDWSQDGDLLDHQTEGLLQLRAGVAYLGSKYPDSTPSVVSFSPATEFNQWAEAALQAPDGDLYRMTVSPIDGGYDCADDYYGLLIREPYDQYVVDTLSEAGFTVLSFTEFPALSGEEVTGSTIVSDLLEIKPPVSRNTHLFIAQADSQDAAAGIKEKLTDAGFYGAYTLYFVPSLDDGAEALEQGRKGWEHVSFNCFG